MANLYDRSVIDRQLIENSVVQLFVEVAIFDKNLPYRSPRIDNFSGSAFVIYKDDDVIICMTNAHVVENNLTIEVRFPFLSKYPIIGKLMSFCFFRDLALVEIRKDKVSEHWDVLYEKVKPLEFADSLLVKQQDRVFVAGYPLGEENLQVASGDVSGFSVTNDIDISFGPKSYIQITAPVNPGNSGGPTLNIKGKVIGINSAGILYASNIAYSIPSRNAVGILDELYKKQFIHQPSFGIKTNSNHNGLYINKIFPNSIFYGDENYDDNIENRINLMIKYYNRLIDPEKDHETHPSKLRKGDILFEITVSNNGQNFTFKLDRYGLSRLENYEWRTFNIDDIEEFTEYGSNVKFKVLRNGQEMLIESEYLPRPISVNMIRPVFPVFEPERFRYLLLAGMLLMENIVSDDDNCIEDRDFFT